MPIREKLVFQKDVFRKVGQRVKIKQMRSYFNLALAVLLVIGISPTLAFAEQQDEDYSINSGQQLSEGTAPELESQFIDDMLLPDDLEQSDELISDEEEVVPQDSRQPEASQDVRAFSLKTMESESAIELQEIVSPLATITLLPGSTSTDLQTAITSAVSGDTIEISSDMTFSGVVSIPTGKTITIQSTTGNNWLLNQTVALVRHFTVDGTLILNNVTLDGGDTGGGITVIATGNVTLNNGVTIQNDLDNALGGGVNNNGTFTMNAGSIIQDNHSNGNGGGVANSGTFTMNSGAIITDNTAVTFGGGVYNNGATASFTMNTGSIISLNSATQGGGVNNSGGATFTMNGNAVIADNVAGQGGGATNVSSTFIMNNGEISGNTTVSANGAGVINSGATATFTMNGGEISGNSTVTSGSGGGVFNVTNATFAMNAGTITGNSAGFGGGVYSTGIFTMEDAAVISNNAADFGAGALNIGSFTMNGGEITGNGTAISGGGGVYNNAGTFTMNAGAAISNNTATQGGGVYNTSVFIMNNSTISGNTATTGNGGGMYLTVAGSLSATNNSSIINNSAPSGNGGGIFDLSIATYGNITTASDTIFSGNTASIAYEPPANASILYPNIGFASTTIADHPLNNYDINFLGTVVITFSVTYSPNGGTGSDYVVANLDPLSTHIVIDNTDPNLGYTRANYTFTGWNAQPDGSGTAYAPGDALIMTDNITLYAQWEIDTFTVTFDSNGGSSVPSQTVEYGGLVTEPANPTRAGFIFQGWFTDDGTFLDAWDFANDVVAGDITLYALWVAESGPGGNGGGTTTTGGGSKVLPGTTKLAQAGVDDLLPLASVTCTAAGILFAATYLIRRKGERG